MNRNFLALNYFSRLQTVQYSTFEASEQNIGISICRIPGHNGIKNNEQADALTKIEKPEYKISISFKDLIQVLKKELRTHLEEQWWV